MGHLTIKFAKYQIYLYIFFTSPKIFIGINQVWPHIQPQKHMEVKLKIYTPCFPFIGVNNEKRQCFILRNLIEIASWIMASSGH